jgi:proteic killer suppression protein
VTDPATATNKNNDLETSKVAKTDHRVLGPRVDDSVTARSLNGIFASCNDTRYTPQVIKSFRHDGLERFFLKGSKAGIQPKHAKRLRLQLTQLDGATSAADMNLPGWDWHPLKSDLAGHWAVSVSGNWRLTFTFEGTDAILVDYQDYR